MAKPSNGKISLVNTEGVTPIVAEKEKSDATIGKVNREIILTFESGSLSARTTTCMPLSPMNNKAVKTDDVDLDEFLGDATDSD